MSITTTPEVIEAIVETAMEEERERCAQLVDRLASFFRNTGRDQEKADRIANCVDELAEEIRRRITGRRRSRP